MKEVQQAGTTPLSERKIETPESRRRRLRDKTFPSANYFTAGMSESEIVEELVALIKEILPLTEVQKCTSTIDLAGGKVVSTAS
jgi:hypothetical protein